MAIPNFLDDTVVGTPYDSLLIRNVSDVNTILAALTAQLVTAPLVAEKWTENPAGTFQSPSDTGGRWLKMAFSRISATNLQVVISDHNAVTICTRRIQIDSGAPYRHVRIFSSMFMCMVESLRSTPEILIGFLVDPTPDGTANVPNPTFGTGYRSAADAADGLGAFGYLFGIDNVATANVGRVRVYGSTFGLIGPVGRLHFQDIFVSQNVGGTVYWVGRAPNVLMGPPMTSVGIGTVKNIPVDTAGGDTRRFIQTAWSTDAYGSLYARID